MAPQDASDPARGPPAKHRPRTSEQLSTPPVEPFSSSSVERNLNPKEQVFGTPFDRWTPLGGGAERDIFRRFNIRSAEEVEFLTHWASRRLSAGFFARDSNGTLVFRISPTDIADLSELDIGNLGSWNHSARWLHVYDREGVSWLTQFRHEDLEALPDLFDGTG